MNSIVLGRGWVMHRRADASVLSFKYPIFNVLLPMSREPSGSKTRLSWLPPLSIRSRDYLSGEGGDLGTLAREFLATKIGYEPEELVLQTLPRMFGYAFNPVSFWHCFDGGKLTAVLCEVNNTFSDRHFYFVENVKTNVSSGPVAKVFHVSPFLPIEGHYEFKFDLSETKSMAQIDYFDKDGKLALATRISLTLAPFEPTEAWKLLFRYGWMTPLVIWRIHSLALKLWWKRARFYSRPTPPQDDLSRSV